MIGDDIMALSKFKKMLVDEEYEDDEEVEETKTKVKESSNNSTNGGKMILLEPRAYSESQQIADHLKKKNTVVVNMKRVTPDQAKRIVDFLSGTVYALGGDLQKIGGGIFLCTPKNVNVEGAITDDDDKSKKSKNDIDLIVVTLKDGDDWNTHKSLYENAFNEYKSYKFLDKDTFKINKDKYYKGRFYIKNDV